MYATQEARGRSPPEHHAPALAASGDSERRDFQRAHHHRADSAGAERRRLPADGCGGLLRRNLLIYGLGGVIAPFVGIKLIDVILTAIGLGLRHMP